MRLFCRFRKFFVIQVEIVLFAYFLRVTYPKAFFCLAPATTDFVAPTCPHVVKRTFDFSQASIASDFLEWGVKHPIRALKTLNDKFVAFCAVNRKVPF